MMHLLIFTCFQEDAMKQLQSLQKEIKDSDEELKKINPLYDNQVKMEMEITKAYVDIILDSSSHFHLWNSSTIKGMSITKCFLVCECSSRSEEEERRVKMCEVAKSGALN